MNYTRPRVGNRIFAFRVQVEEGERFGFQINSATGKNNGAPVLRDSFEEMLPLLVQRVSSLAGKDKLPENINFRNELPRSLNVFRKKDASAVRALLPRQRSEVLVALYELMFPPSSVPTEEEQRW